MGYIKSHSDHCLFIKSVNSNFTAILVYVDDLVLIGNDLDNIESTKATLHKKFGLKDLGMEIARSKQGIHLYQRKYTLDLLQQTRLLGSKPATTPIEYNTKIHAAAGTPLTDPSPYRRLMGKLLYLTHTRPDICFAVGCLSQYLAAPIDVHIQGANKIVRYLKQSPSRGIFFPSTNSISIKGYSDWATCPDTRRSVTLFISTFIHPLSIYLVD
ncbi:PREDICTED: uncharacterized protein LOC109329347 [Lupinus angustifolius]|uniref:uncharacterized protein LOC109329347 n=1 Tax=Lupinus angustifolius TaxID=3871 RepID=UPI00092E351E|nr:PREDICTED: uncharacterized protein LOC109329347 [Lupinus angustifolius]